MPSKKLLLLISAALFFLFVFFSYLVAKETFTQLDFDTTVRVQDNIPHKVDFIFSIFSVIGSVELTGLFMFLLLIFFIIRKKFLTTASLFLLPFALFLEVFGKFFVYHPGPPYLFYRGVIKFDFFPKEYVPHEYSYPSGHMLRISFILTFLFVWAWFILPRKYSLIIFLIISGFYLIMGISRVYLGEHWTSDVIGGALLGSSFGLLSGLTLQKTKVSKG